MNEPTPLPPPGPVPPPVPQPPTAQWAPGTEPFAQTAPSRAARPAVGAKAKTWRFPIGAVALGIIGGGLLGSLLAWGIIGIVHWRRDAAAQAEAEAGEAEARRLMEVEAARKAKEQGNDAWRRWATEKRAP